MRRVFFCVCCVWRLSTFKLVCISKVRLACARQIALKRQASGFRELRAHLSSHRSRSCWCDFRVHCMGGCQVLFAHFEGRCNLNILTCYSNFSTNNDLYGLLSVSTLWQPPSPIMQTIICSGLSCMNTKWQRTVAQRRRDGDTVCDGQVTTNGVRDVMRNSAENA